MPIILPQFSGVFIGKNAHWSHGPAPLSTGKCCIPPHDKRPPGRESVGVATHRAV